MSQPPAEPQRQGEAPVQAAGGLLWRRRCCRSEIAVIHRKRYDDWCLPKGKIQPGESHEEAALREVREETGYEARLCGFVGEISYSAAGRPKTVRFWNMEAEGQPGPYDSEEVADVVWMRPRKAAQRLTYSGERGLVLMAKTRESWPSHFGMLSRFRILLGPQRRRLIASLNAYETELQHYADPPPTERQHWKNIAKRLLAQAREALQRGRADEGWRCFAAAARMELFGMSPEQRELRAAALRNEASSKLKGWRKEAVLKALEPPEDGGPVMTPERLHYAALVRDEDFNNWYFKAHHLRLQLVVLMTILLATVATIGALSEPGWFDPTRRLGVVENGANVGNNRPERLLFGVILFGIAGGCFSAILSLARTSVSRRIPEQIVDSYITALRPVLGAAGALAAFVFLLSGVVRVTGDLSPPAALMIAFVAGFSERLVARAAGSATREPET